MNSTSPPQSIFVLPRGAELGGITTWSVRMARQLQATARMVSLLKHQRMPGEPSDEPLLHGLSVVDCPGKAAWGVTLNDIVSYLPSYSTVLPGMLIPNWTYGTYATCALLSTTAADRMRVLGVAHSDESIYYDCLSYYESIIHTFVAVSDEIATTLAASMPHRAEDIVVRPCAVLAPPSQPVVGRSYSTATQPIRLMYAGRVQNQQKRVYDLLILARLLKQRQLNFHLDIVGSGSEELWLRQQFQQLLGAELHSKGSTVVFVGSVPHVEMAHYWQQADICVLVSEFEGTSIAMLEAMAQGCVPVVTQVSGTKAVIQPGVNGFVVPVGAMNILADRIEGLVCDRTQLAQMGQAARVSVTNRFSRERYLEWFTQLSEAIWQQPPRQWPLGRNILPARFQPPPSPTRLQRARRKVDRTVDQLRLHLKIRGMWRD